MNLESLSAINGMRTQEPDASQGVSVLLVELVELVKLVDRVHIRSVGLFQRLKISLGFLGDYVAWSDGKAVSLATSITSAGSKNGFSNDESRRRYPRGLLTTLHWPLR